MNPTRWPLHIFLLAQLSACAHAPHRPHETGAVLSAHTEAGVAVTLRIDGVEPDDRDPEGEVYLYTVSFLDPSDQQWKPLCKPDLEHRVTSIPLQGSWTASGDYVPSETVITFACTNGVIGKCVRWGYKPWKTVPGISMRDYHQTCTRMARADYCGNGHGHTRDGTTIDLYDDVGVQVQTPDNHLVFEAAWSPTGATYVNKARYAESLASLEAECPERLMGRTALELPGLTPTEIKARWPETLLFNDSALRTDPP